jgi:hypothetical protein
VTHEDKNISTWFCAAFVVRLGDIACNRACKSAFPHPFFRDYEDYLDPVVGKAASGTYHYQPEEDRNRPGIGPGVRISPGAGSGISK